MTMSVSQNGVCEPDFWARPAWHPQSPVGQGIDLLGSPYLSMVMEAGHTQSLGNCHSRVTEYFSPQTTICIFLVIKSPGGQYYCFGGCTLPSLKPNSIDVRSFGTADLDLQT